MENKRKQDAAKALIGSQNGLTSVTLFLPLLHTYKVHPASF